MSAMVARLLVLLACLGCGQQPAPHRQSGPSPTTSTTTANVAWPVPQGWRSEVIRFPLDFAPSLPHRGYEDLRFPPGMFDPAAPGYWSYAFLWRTDDAAELDATVLASELTTYFRGLIAAVDDKHRITARDDIAVQATADGSRFALTAHIFDAFKTAQPVTLTGWAERRACTSGALWVFVLARDGSPLRATLDDLARQAGC